MQDMEAMDFRMEVRAVALRERVFVMSPLPGYGIRRPLCTRETVGSESVESVERGAIWPIFHRKRHLLRSRQWRPRKNRRQWRSDRGKWTGRCL